MASKATACMRPFTQASSGGDFVLNIGDVTVPVPANITHPERVVWLFPGAATSHNTEDTLNDDAAAAAAAVDADGNNATTTSSNSSSKKMRTKKKSIHDYDGPTPRMHDGNAFFHLQDHTTRAYLRWICQKEQLRQDMCLVGEPGPAMRWLVQMYSHLVRRELQCVTLNRDITESDLGQRREIRNGTLVYDDQCVVVAAREGQLLLLEGLEKVERNVLPVVNNLLENREMHLENGMMLIHPERYDRLLQELIPAKRRKGSHNDANSNNNNNNTRICDDGNITLAAAHEEMHRMGFIRVSENFRVIGITVPVPPYDGNPLDPPLRSRFQCLYVNIPLGGMGSRMVAGATAAAGGTRSANAVELLLKLRTAIDEVNMSTKEFTGSGATGMHRGLPSIGSYELAVLSRQLQLFPDIPVGNVLPRAFPWLLYAQQTSSAGAAHVEEATRRRREYEKLLVACQIGFPWGTSPHVKCGDEMSPTAGAVGAGGKGTSTALSSSSRAHGWAGGVRVRVREQVASSRCPSSANTSEMPPAPSPEQFNYVQRVEKIRVEERHLGSVAPANATVDGAGIVLAVVMGDACIAGSSGTYRLPIYLGDAVAPQASTTVPRAGEAGTRLGAAGRGKPANADGFDVAACCPTQRSIFTPAHHYVLQSMLQLHIAGQHILLLGPTGCGKTVILHEFAHLLGYRTETMYLYADMTNKDLFQRRTTEPSTGDTTWKNSALVDAALGGHIAVLDGVDKLPYGMLSSLQQLLVDGSASLYDGTVLKSLREYEILRQKMNATDDEMRKRSIFPVHPAFRVVATARPEAVQGGGGKAEHSRWRISHEVTSLFGLVTMPAATQATLHAILSQVAAEELRSWQKEGLAVSPPEALAAILHDVDRLLRLRDALEQLQVTEPKIPQLSLRQLLHLIRFRVRYQSDFTPGVESALLLPLMNTLTAGQIRQVMRSCGFDDVKDDHEEERQAKRHAPRATGTDLRQGFRRERNDTLIEVPSSTSSGTVDGGSAARVFALHKSPVLCINRAYTAKEQAMVPYVPYFHPNPLHESIIAWLAKQYAVGNNILLIGNQGVGKNKVVDAFLARIRVPRQYIQLHRDTTVGSLTINPTVEGGQVIWADSPLVKAVQFGHCLVVDEIDKAPVEVVQVLKGLVEDHEMRLRDGRRVQGPKARANSDKKNKNNNNNNNGDVCNSGNVIPMHPDFRIIVLANPPGFPFHGNDFYRECGDLFASYVMSNPDSLSQLRVLKAYSPNLPDALLERLIAAFQRLQKSFEEGHLTYPFSLRELIAVVKHMTAFPHDGIYVALNNVFGFDTHDENTLHLVRQVLQLHLHPLIGAGGMHKILPLRTGQAVPLQVREVEVASSSSIGHATPLPVRLLSIEECGGPSVAHPVPVWREQYSEADFTAVMPGGETEGFTEWMTVSPRLPFLCPDDTLLGVAATDATDIGIGTIGGIAVLFLRPDTTTTATTTTRSSRSKRVLLAVMALPSVTSLGMTPVRRLNLNAGQVQFFDLTDLVSTASSLSLHSFHAERDGASLVGAPGDYWLRDGFGAGSPLMAVLDASSGVVLLVNTSAPAARVGSPAPESSLLPPPPPPQQQQQQQQQENEVGSVLSVRLAPPSVEGLPGRYSVRPGSGIIAMTRPHNAELYVWMNGHRIVVTLPAKSIEEVHYLTDNLASVRLSASEAIVQGVLKVEVTPDGTAKASLLMLPEGIAGTVVGVSGSQTLAASSGKTLLQPLTPDELRGCVIVPNSDTAGVDNVVYMTVDGYSSQKKAWSMRAFTDADAAAEVRTNSLPRGALKVDRKHCQLLASGRSRVSGLSGSVTAVDFQQHTVRRFAPRALPQSSSSSSSPSSSSSSAAAAASAEASCLSSSTQQSPPLFTVDEGAGVALWYGGAQQQLLVADVVAERVEHRYRNISSLLEGTVNQVGAGAAPTTREPLSMSYSEPRKKPSSNLKHGKEDDEEHHGGNTYAGGTGGTDTAGLGGLVGPYRLDKGRPVHQVSPEAKRQVPPHIIEEARRMGKAALEERLREIGMTSKEYEQYREFQRRVCAPVALLRGLMSGLKTAEGERTWLRGQTDGVWDDSKIVEGIVGERNIYKRRADSTEINPFKSKLKKRLLFVLDVSASMYRFEGMDQRLTKLLESTVMVMEAFSGFEEKIDYAMIGHNGDSACIELVSFGRQPATQKERMDVCQRMVAHAQYCWSGDNTVEAMRQSIDLVTASKGEAYLVFVISDANLARYGIEPRELSAIMRSHSEVQMFCIFIATLGEQASNLQAEMPVGHGFECMDTKALPHILKQIFMSVNLL